MRYFYRWLVLILVVAQSLVGALPVLAQGNSHAVNMADDPRKRMLLTLAGDAIGPNTVQLALTATPAMDAPALQVSWDIGNARIIDGATSETLGALAADASTQVTRHFVLPAPGLYPLTVSVTYQPSPDWQFGAATILYALVDAQGGVTLTARDPNAHSPMHSIMPETVTKLETNAHTASLQETNDDPCFTVVGTVMRQDRQDTQTGRQAPVMVPVRNARVEMREEDLVFDDSYGEVVTDNSGNYSFSFCDDDGWFDDELELYVRLRAELFVGDFSVVEVTDSSWIDETYEFDSGITPSEGGSYRIDFNLDFDQSGVFNIADAVLDGWNFWNASGGATGDDAQFGDQAEVHWEPGYGDSGSYYNGDLDYNEITIADTAPDADQWDDPVIIHEWGHQADDNYGCDDNPGGKHSYGQVLGDPELAWGEAYPDYWQSAVRSGLGKTDGNWYFDANDAGTNMLAFNLESNPTSANAAVEDAIATMLWDLADSATDGQDTMGVGHPTLQQVYTDPAFEANGDVFDDTCTVFMYLLAWKQLNKPTDAATAASITQNIGLATPFASVATAGADATTSNATVASVTNPQDANQLQETSAVNVPGGTAEDYVWWKKVTMVADNSASMDGPKFDAVKTVMQEQVNDLQDEPNGVEFALYNFDNTLPGSQELVRGRFFPNFILPAVDGMTTTSGGFEPCAVNAFDALAASIQDKENGEAWLYTDGDTTLGPGVEAMEQMLTTRGLHGSFVMMGGCSSPPDAQPDTLGVTYNFLGKAANGTQSSGIVPYLLTAIASGGNFLFVDQSQLSNAGEILRAQLSHSAGAGRWSDYVSRGPTYTWDKLTSWEYNWVDANDDDDDDGDGQPDVENFVGSPQYPNPTEVTLPQSFLVYGGSYDKLRAYEDGYLQMGGIPSGGPIVVLNNRYLNVLNADLAWTYVICAAGVSSPQCGGPTQSVITQDAGEWYAITTEGQAYGDGPRAYQVLLNKNTGEIRYQYKAVAPGDAGSAVIGVESFNTLTLDSQEVVVSNKDTNGAFPNMGYKFTPMPPQPSKTFTVPVDALMGGAGFLLTGYSGDFAPLAVTDPDGNAVNCGAEGSLCLNLGLVQYVQTNVNGRNGNWHAVVSPGASGEGTFSFSAMGASAIKVSSPFDHQLALGAASKLAINLGALAESNQLTAWFQKPDGSLLGSQFTLFDDGSNGDEHAGDRQFSLGNFTPPGGGVAYLWVRGTVNGTELQRSDPTPYNFQPFNISGPTKVDYLGSGEMHIEYTMTNYSDKTYCYDHAEQLPTGWTGQWGFTVVDVTSGFCIGPNASETRTFRVTPTSLQDPAPSGSFGEFVVSFSETERGQIADSAATMVVRHHPPARVVIENHFSSTYVRPNGVDTVPLSVGVFDDEGFPVVDGTLVDLVTTLGAVSPAQGGTVNGQLLVTFTAGNTPGKAVIKATVAGVAQVAQTEIKIHDAVADTMDFEVNPSDLRQAKTANLKVTVHDHWGDPVAGAIVRIGAEDDSQSGSVTASAATQANLATTLQFTDVVTLTTDAQGQASAIFTKDDNAVGRVGVRADLLFDEGSGLEINLEERREIILSDSGIGQPNGNLFIPSVRKAK